MNRLTLAVGGTRALVLPDHGGAAAELTVDGTSVLARTPWAAEVLAGREPASDEATWVGRWTGGWQLCFPNAGAPDPDARPAQGFHGVASQDRWSVGDTGDAHVDLHWADEAGLSIRRRWVVSENTLAAVTTARNGGEASRPIGIAEHLILGGEVLAPVVDADGMLRIDASGLLVELDYAGTPTGRRTAWPGEEAWPGGNWARVDRRTPARVAALRHPSPGIVTVTGPRLRATVSWEGLAHALLWEEIGASTDAPWNGAVHALGVEPTSTPHGAGTAYPDGAIDLAPGQSMTWTTRLEIGITDMGAATPADEGGRA
ncbi:hypothetical protein [Microbacterium invictum]|uniref:Galactose mutarotase n=1 Tax=Microbacterium invictum TaxID=515415 RepID=A0ABZ0VAJ0_9MICO|nr:hypothetical protein [Microbacterium invictum]WQB69903.1 hypothetical protein T9R20_14570 [Microbacterium invictum]